MASFFLTKTIDDAKGLELGRIYPSSSNSLIVFSISSLYLLGCLYGFVMTACVPSSNSIMCSNPLSGGRPAGRSLNTLSCFCNSAWISVGCWVLLSGDFLIVTSHSAAHSMSPYLSMASILCDDTGLGGISVHAPQDYPFSILSLELHFHGPVIRSIFPYWVEPLNP